MIASYSFQRGFAVRFYIQPGHAKREPVLDQRQMFEYREALYWNVGRLRPAAASRPREGALRNQEIAKVGRTKGFRPGKKSLASFREAV